MQEFWQWPLSSLGERQSPGCVMFTKRQWGPTSRRATRVLSTRDLAELQDHPWPELRHQTDSIRHIHSDAHFSPLSQIPVQMTHRSHCWESFPQTSQHHEGKEEHESLSFSPPPYSQVTLSLWPTQIYSLINSCQRNSLNQTQRNTPLIDIFARSKHFYLFSNNLSIQNSLTVHAKGEKWVCSPANDIVFISSQAQHASRIVLHLCFTLCSIL